MDERVPVLGILSCLVQVPSQPVQSQSIVNQQRRTLFFLHCLSPASLSAHLLSDLLIHDRWYNLCSAQLSQFLLLKEAALWPSLTHPDPTLRLQPKRCRCRHARLSRVAPSPQQSQHLLPASLPPQVPASPDPLRYLRYATQSATTLFNTLQVTATLVGRNPPPGPGHPPPKPTAYTYLGLVIYPSRIPPTAASSNLFIRTLLLPCLALSCRAILLLVAAISLQYDQYLQHLSAQYRICHVRHNVLSRTLCLSVSSSSLCST